MYEGLSSPWCYGRKLYHDERPGSNCDRERYEEKETENFINLGTNVKFVQTGDANGGNGGHSGDGGDGGVITNVATALIGNIVVVVANEEENAIPGIALGFNERQLDFKMDEKGNAFINGKKMDEAHLDNGTRVYLFKDGVTKSSTTTK